jgi:transcriptional regulator with XRE-family HTH domain
MQTFPLALGRCLRKARRSRGWTLREASDESDHRFKPTSLASYERGERQISTQRFSELAQLYGVSPARLLADVLREAEGRPPTVVDIAGMEGLEVSEARAVATFIENVIGLRGIEGSRTITLRQGDLEVLATSVGERVDHFAEKLQPALRRSTEDD